MERGRADALILGQGDESAAPEKWRFAGGRAGPCPQVLQQG